MDLFNTFLLANLVGCVAVVIVAIEPIAKLRKLFAKINVPGVSGALVGASTVSLVARLFV
jgi:hypothetical protein